MLTVGEGAGVHLVLGSVSRSTTVEVSVGADAKFTLSFVGVLTQHHTFNLRVQLVGSGADAHCQLACVGAPSSEGVFHLALEHIAPRTRGRVTARRAQFEDSLSALYGRLNIHMGAHGTDTYLSDKALLLGDKAKAVSVPSLEILADDVKASHGASSGKLSQDELFYVRSRGLPLHEAEGLLVSAFLESVMVGVPPSLRETIKHYIEHYAESRLA